VITISITLCANGCVKQCRAEGHSGYEKKGKDIVCAGVTVLVRTAAKALYGEGGISIEGSAPEEGTLWFSIHNIPENKVGWVKGITDYLITGLGELSTAYPDMVRIEIKQ
jgi:uncharacterized protein YsxB (DUF464 family)